MGFRFNFKNYYKDTWSVDVYEDFKKGIPIKELCVKYSASIEEVKRNIRCEKLKLNSTIQVIESLIKDANTGFSSSYLCEKYLFSRRAITYYVSADKQIREMAKKNKEYVRQKYDPHKHPNILLNHIYDIDTFKLKTQFILPYLLVCNDTRIRVYKEMRWNEFKSRFTNHLITAVKEIPNNDTTLVYIKDKGEITNEII